jgi:uncharacterized protein YndB with AHSA1/START domain
MKTKPLVIESTFNVPIEKIWFAITDKDEMKQWYFDLTEFEPKVGFKFQFSANKDGKEYIHLCKITEIIAGKKLTYSWRYKGYLGNSSVTFELFPEDNKTILKLTHKGLETFSANNNPDFDKKNFLEGWNFIINKSLREFVEK